LYNYAKKGFNLSVENLEYVLDVHYSSSYPSDYGCECDGDDYCRCEIIRKDDITMNTTQLTSERLLDFFIESLSIINDWVKNEANKDLVREMKISSICNER